MLISANTSVLKTIWAIIPIAILGLISCEPEVVSRPEVQISQPFVNEVFGFGDTIWVEAVVSHPDLQAINLSLVDDQFKGVEPNQSISVGSNRATFTAFIVIANKNLSSGTHYVEIAVRAGGELFNFHKEVRVFELPLERLDFFIVTTTTLGRKLSNTYNGSATIPGPVYIGLGDHSGIASNNNSGTVFIAPKTTGNLLQISFNGNGIVWEDINNVSGGATFMTGVKNTGGVVYGFYGDGRVIAYEDYGGYDLIIQLPTGYIPQDVIRRGNTLVVFARNGNQARLYYYNASSGAYIRHQEVPQNQEHIALQPFGINDFLMIYNSNGTAGWNRYQINGQEINIQALPNMILYDAIAITSDQVIFSSDQGIQRFDSAQPTLSTLVSAAAEPIVMAYDVASGELIYAVNDQIRLIQLPSEVTSGIYYMPNHDFADLTVLYNK